MFEYIFWYEVKQWFLNDIAQKFWKIMDFQKMINSHDVQLVNWPVKQHQPSAGYLRLTRALLGLWIFSLDFPPPAGGGGAFERPPWSRLLVVVEENERQRSKARKKSFRNHFGHFLAQVKI